MKDLKGLKLNLICSERVSDQEEIMRTGQKLKDEIIANLIEELNNVDEDPLTPDQLKKLL